MSDSKPARIPIIAAFLAVYLFWGSSYLAIRFAIETIPPFIMIGGQLWGAGLLLLFCGLWRGEKIIINKEHGKEALKLGLLLGLGGNGGLVWAEQRVSSSVAALLISLEALWIVLFAWAFGKTKSPRKIVLAAILGGLVGIAVLVYPQGAEIHRIDLWGASALLLASICWGVGTVLSKNAKLPQSLAIAAGMQMGVAGGSLFLLALFVGEFSAFTLAAISLKSFLAFLFLMICGSFLGFTSYFWLVQVVSPAQVSTYAYVAPIVAMVLGVFLGDETIHLRMLVAAAIIIVSVFTIIYFSRESAQKNTEAPEN